MKFLTLELACQYCQAHDGLQVYSWMMEHHPAVTTSKDEALNCKEYWTVKKKVPVPLGMGRLHWVTVKKE